MVLLTGVAEGVAGAAKTVPDVAARKSATINETIIFFITDSF